MEGWQFSHRPLTNKQQRPVCWEISSLSNVKEFYGMLCRWSRPKCRAVGSISRFEELMEKYGQKSYKNTMRSQGARGEHKTSKINKSTGKAQGNWI